MQRNAISAKSLWRADGARLRRAAWIALFVLGLCFWIPGLLRARLGASAMRATSDADSEPASDVASPAQLAETPATIPAGSPATCRLAVPTGRLVVTATILGKARRAAIVNARLYREGDKITAGSELYRLASVGEDRIELVSLGPSGTKRVVSLKAGAESERDPSGSH